MRRLRHAFPAAAASLFDSTSFATQIHWTDAYLSVRRSAWPGGSIPGRYAVSPRQSGSSPGCCRVVREVSQCSRRPSAVSGMPLPLLNQRHGVPCLARCISPPAAILSRRGTWVAGFRDRAGFPRQTLDYASAPGFPDCRVSPVNDRSATVDAELLRRAQDALDFRVAPARPHKGGYKAGRILQASSAGHQLNFPARARRLRVRDAFGAPSLPKFHNRCGVRYSFGAVVTGAGLSGSKSD